MARDISALVGIKGRNLYDDVVTVQELLNNVSPTQGGPSRKLKVDGLCGPKTKRAIQEFQLHHFGWKGADGRVDPGHQTIKRLNELQPGPAKPTKPPPRTTPPQVKVKTTLLVVQQAGTAGTLASGPEDYFFRVHDGQNRDSRLSRVYWLGYPRGYLAVRKRPKFPRSRAALTIHRLSPPPVSVSELECMAMYVTRGGRGGFKSQLILMLPTPQGVLREVRIPVHRHMMSGRGESAGESIAFAGHFQLVRNPNRWVTP